LAGEFTEKRTFSHNIDIRTGDVVDAHENI
jgi:hypothetical protein